MQGGLFARKVGMTQVFDKSGNILPVTILKVGLCKVSQIKTVISDGYNSIQVAYESQKLEKLNRPIRGHLKKVCSDIGFRSFGEFYVSEPQNFKLGEIIKADTFFVGQKVRVTGRILGKGFSGNQKRHNFSRGPMTHGSKNHRLPGSIGAGSTPGRVYPGKKMAGRSGRGIVTVTNSGILFVNAEDNIIVLKGSVPGKINSILKIQPQKY